MTMPDPLGMRDPQSRSFWSNDDVFTDPKIKEKVLRKLEELRREIPRVRNAAGQLEHDIRQTTPSVEQRTGQLPAQASKELLRNWILSLIESFGYIERMCGDLVISRRYAEMLTRAADLGHSRALRDGAKGC
jgi:hypothetical protein